MRMGLWLTVLSGLLVMAICAFGEALSWPAQALIRKFPEEFAKRIEESLVGINGRKSSGLNYELAGAH